MVFHGKPNVILFIDFFKIEVSARRFVSRGAGTFSKRNGFVLKPFSEEFKHKLTLFNAMGADIGNLQRAKGILFSLSNRLGEKLSQIGFSIDDIRHENIIIAGLIM